MESVTTARQGASYDVVIVGAGFTGLAAGLDLVNAGLRVCVVERDAFAGGLAGAFEFRNGVRIEKFYHHWFNHDKDVLSLIQELGLGNHIVTRPSQTGMYYNGRLWRLSKPLDVLRFSPLPIIDRIRLGWLVFQVRAVKDWRSIEHLSIREWLEPLCGRQVFRVVWEPLIKAKFSVYAERVGAVWFWNKLVLRGGSRDGKGGEQLAYLRGGFAKLANAIVERIRRAGSDVLFETPASGVKVKQGRIEALTTTKGDIHGREFLFTPAFPIIADLFAHVAERDWLQKLRRVEYLGNICLVLQLERSLSTTYWLNVNDPGFPFVGVIEHTNFDSPEHYAGTHLAYLSRYLPTEDPVWRYSDEEYFNLALTHLKRMFPAFDRSWVIDYRVWRAQFSQPVTERNYSSMLPGNETPFRNASIATMAHIYPEDRGTNYAVRDGRGAAGALRRKLLTAEG